MTSRIGDKIKMESRLGDRYLVTMGPTGNVSGAEYRVPLNEVLYNPNTSPEDLVTLTDVLLASFGQYSDSRREISSGNVKFQCNHCGKLFNWKHQVKKHLRSHRHDIETAYLCYECGKVYPRPENLNRHTSAVHRYIRQHACPECGERFNRASDVDVHRKMEHPYSIVTVDVRDEEEEEEDVTDSDTKPVKRRKSRDDSPDEELDAMSESEGNSDDVEEEGGTKCKKCGRGFHRPAHLKRHMRVHATDKQFECPFSCGCSYTQVSYLRNHISRAHDDVVHKCGVCGKLFETEFRLENHLKMHARTRTARQRRQEDDSDWQPHI